MAVLEGFERLLGSGGLLSRIVVRDQLNEPTNDGRPDENARANCVMASYAAGLTYVTSINYYGDALKDFTYGEAYRGGTNPEAVASKVPAFTGNRARAWVVRGSQPQLLAAIKREIDAGHPVVIEIPSAASSSRNPLASTTIPNGNPLAPGVGTHANCVFGYRNGNLVVMDPWGGWVHEASEGWWQSQLVYGRVEPIASMQGGTDFGMLEINQTAGMFTQVGDQWKAKNGQMLFGAILEFYRQNAGLRLFGLPITGELAPDPNYGGKVRVFERGAIAYDPSHKWDGVPGEAHPSCYAAHVDAGPVLNSLAAAVVTERDAARRERDAAVRERDAARSEVAPLKAQAEAAEQRAADAQAKLDGQNKAVAALVALGAALKEV